MHDSSGHGVRLHNKAHLTVHIYKVLGEIVTTRFFVSFSARGQVHAIYPSLMTLQEKRETESPPQHHVLKMAFAAVAVESVLHVMAPLEVSVSWMEERGERMYGWLVGWDDGRHNDGFPHEKSVSLQRLFLMKDRITAAPWQTTKSSMCKNLDRMIFLSYCLTLF